MIADDIFPVYAQYHEDIILAALLQDVKKGFYVDVGANHEEYHSVTKYFYDRGWRGINIEPIPRLIKEFTKKRPRDINLECAVSSKPGTMKLREYPNQDGLSTLSTAAKKENEKDKLLYKEYDVRVDSLEDIFKEQKVKKIDFLKVDVEGYEEEVLKSNSWDKYRPTVICVEANHRNNDWSIYLSKQKYRCVIFDGLNEYYIAQESVGIFTKFAERATTLAHNALRGHHKTTWEDDLNTIKQLRDLSARQDTQIQAMQKTLLELEDRFSSIGFVLKRLAYLFLKLLHLKK